MRREKRGRFKSYKFFYIIGVVAILLALLLVILYNVYNKKLNDISKSMLSSERIIGLVPNTAEDEKNPIETTGSTISKTIEQVQEEIEKKEEKNVENETTQTSTTEENIQKVEEKPIAQEDVKKELVFAYPVEGEILRNYAMEELIFSATLDEWTVHQGMDIKADRTTIVKAAEEGTVAAIKNDPRYGLTVIIEHQDGFKTIYSNLLTTEFVAEDEKVEKGQSIGTIGNSAVFEIADEPHLHFEMLKDGEYVDPKLYLK